MQGSKEESAALFSGEMVQPRSQELVKELLGWDRGKPWKPLEVRAGCWGGGHYRDREKGRQMFKKLLQILPTFQKGDRELAGSRIDSGNCLLSRTLPTPWFLLCSYLALFLEIGKDPCCLWYQIKWDYYLASWELCEEKGPVIYTKASCGIRGSLPLDGPEFTHGAHCPRLSCQGLVVAFRVYNGSRMYLLHQLKAISIWEIPLTASSV